TRRTGLLSSARFAARGLHEKESTRPRLRGTDGRRCRRRVRRRAIAVQNHRLSQRTAKRTSERMSTPFLAAQWRHLAMLNYEIDPAVLQPFVPRGTELDTWNGQTFASLVGFLFLDTRVLGVAVPLHTDFEE